MTHFHTLLTEKRTRELRAPNHDGQRGKYVATRERIGNDELETRATTDEELNDA